MFNNHKWVELILIIVSFILIMVIFSGSIFALEGYITEIDIDKRAVRVKNNWYYLQEETIIKRNNIKGSLKLCQVIANKYQWAQLKFDSENNLKKIIINYQIKEGLIKAINYIEGSIKLELYQETNTNNVDQFKIDDSNILRKFRVGQHVVFIVTGEKVLEIF